LRSISVVTNRFEGLRSRWMPSGVEHNFRSRVVSGHVERSRRSYGVPRAVAKRFARLVAWNPPKAGFPKVTCPGIDPGGSARFRDGLFMPGSLEFQQ
jgi:hypothetical protein